MRNFMAVLLGASVLLTAVGCQPGQRGVDVFVSGEEGFPPQLAGKWVAPEKDFWTFEFRPDGSISHATIGMGGVEVSPGRVSKFPARHGGEGVFKPGRWTVRYDEVSRELSVEVVIEQFHLDTRGGNALEGSTTDLLVGPVSEDYSTWEADWLGKETLVAFLPEPKEFSNVKEFEFKKKIIFTRPR